MPGARTALIAAASVKAEHPLLRRLWHRTGQRRSPGQRHRHDRDGTHLS